MPAKKKPAAPTPADSVQPPMLEPQPYRDDQEDEGPLVADGLEDAYVGMVFRFGMLEPIACYDMNRVLEIFMEDGCTEEEALEHFEYNVIGAWAGERTPCFIRTDVRPEDYVEGWEGA